MSLEMRARKPLLRDMRFKCGIIRRLRSIIGDARCDQIQIRFQKHDGWRTPSRRPPRPGMARERQRAKKGVIRTGRHTANNNRSMGLTAFDKLI